MQAMLWRPRSRYDRDPTDYRVGGMGEVARNERKINPLTATGNSSDPSFKTLFQQDYYETAILSKANPIIMSQYIDWETMAGYNDPIFTQIVEACEVKGLKTILGYQHDWNVEIIAQFYAIAYFDESAADKRQWVLHWMTEGNPFSVTYAMFASFLGFGDDDLGYAKIHGKGHLPAERTKFMYPPANQGNIGKVVGLYTYY